MATKATTIQEYLTQLPADRRAAIQTLRKVIKQNLGPGYQEAMQYGMIGYSVPHSVYPAGYHCDPKQPLPFVSVASQKNHLAIYLFCIYCDPKQQARFEKEWKASGHKLDMGKGCVRFKGIDDVPLDVVGAAIQRIAVEDFIQAYEAALTPSARAKHDKLKAKLAAGGSAKPSKATAKKNTAKKKTAKKKAVKKR